MLENRPGGSGGFDADELAKQDADRAREIERRKSLTKRRRGHKGSRVWGWMPVRESGK